MEQPLYIDYSVLYTNTELLEKYNSGIPKTWKEFIKVADYIYSKEIESGNTDIIGYNGLFSGKLKKINK